MDAADLDRLAKLFRRFAEIECPHLPVYHRLCLATADSPELLDLYEHTPDGPQRRPNLLLAAVHDLLLSGTDHPLRRWYPTVNGGRMPPDEDPFPAFVDLICDHRKAIVELLATRTTQTNEVNRSCLWRVAVPFAVADRPPTPLALVEVGASAGLNLNVDRYRYDFGDGVIRGAADSPAELSCPVVSGDPPLDTEIDIVARVGLDAHPVDVCDDRETRWLQACIWPEQRERQQRFLGAVEVCRAHPPRIVPGDAVDDLGPLIDSIDPGAHVVVINSWVLTYLSPRRRAEFVDMMDAIGRGRGELTWLSAEHSRCLETFPAPPSNDTIVALRTWRGGEQRSTILADVHPHLEWMRWRPRSLDART